MVWDDELILDYIPRIDTLIPSKPPPPVFLIHSSPRTVVHLVALHILPCHLVSPVWALQGSAFPLIFIFHEHIVPTAFLQHIPSTSPLPYLFISTQEDG